MPSPAEWKDAWAELSELCSLRKIGRVTEKKAGTASGVGGMNRIRKRRRKQLAVMAEVTRRRIREALWRATSITLALDESKYRKIVFTAAEALAASLRSNPAASHGVRNTFSPRSLRCASIRAATQTCTALS